MTAPPIQLGVRQPVMTEPFQGVRDTTDPLDEGEHLAVDATNCYVADVQGTSGFYARPGCVIGNIQNPLPGKGQGGYSFTDLTGTTYNFIVDGGKLFRADTGLENYTDVTPLAAQQVLAFVSGQNTEPNIGQTLTGATSGATGVIAAIRIDSGTFVTSNATGVYTLSTVTGTFNASENLKVGATVVGITNGLIRSPIFGISSTAPRVFFSDLDGQLILSDGVNPPWIASSLSSTPVVATSIDFDGNGVSWSAYHMDVYAGSIIFILNQVGGVYARSDIVYSNPGDPTTGYQQLNFDFRWTLEQTGSAPLNGLCGTNTSLFYWRDKAIGALSGIPGPSFQGSATHDAISVEVGTLAPATIQLFGTSIFFCDQVGRPWMLPVVWYQASESRLVPLWLAMRSLFESSTYIYPTATAQVACAAIEPLRELYVAAIWSPIPGAASAPTQAVVFDAKTGAYQGRWIIGNNAGIETMCVLNNANGQSNLCFVGTAPPSPQGDLLSTESGLVITTESGLGIDTIDTITVRTGVVWIMNGVVAAGIPIAMENGNIILMQDGITQIATEDTAVTWQDNGEVPDISVTTGRLGYSADKVWNWDLATILLGSQTPISVSTITTSMNNVVEGTPAGLNNSYDLTYRLVVGLQAQGRGLQLVISPTTANSQFIFHQAIAMGIPSLAGIEEA